MVGAFFSEMSEGLARFSKDVIFPGDQLRAEVCPLAGIHELIVFREHIFAKIDLLTQRDSPRRTSQCGGVYSNDSGRFKSADQFSGIFKTDTKII
jgi:hypothetical protein